MSKELPLLVLGRNYVMTTKLGHSIEFKKGQPTKVPPAIYKDAVAIGALPADESDVSKIFEDAPVVKAPVDPETRNPRILASIKKIIDRNEREDFTAAGTPTVESVTSDVGFRVSSKEISVQWQAYNDEKAND